MDEQNQLETETEETRPYYKCVSSSTQKGFIKQLNTAHKQGYKPIWETKEEYTDTEYVPPITTRKLYVYDSEALGMDNTETSKRVQISEDIMESEFQYSKAKDQLKKRETELLKDTDWETVGMEEYQTVKPTVKQKESYIYDKTSLEREWFEAVERWLKHVKRLEKIHERADGNPPWKPEPQESPEVVVDEDVGGMTDGTL